MKQEDKTIEIPFGAFDSELGGFEYTIPDGYEAEIKDGKVIVRKAESEDERIRTLLIDFIRNYNWLRVQSGFKGATKEDVIAWLEEQGEQKPVEWSEEDEEMLDSIVNSIEITSGRIALPSLKENYTKQVDWLKSLRPQKHWKPTEEQLEALQKVISGFVSGDFQVLKRLHTELKAL